VKPVEDCRQDQGEREWARAGCAHETF
jgi:hypothetical protein